VRQRQKEERQAENDEKRREAALTRAVAMWLNKILPDEQNMVSFDDHVRSNRTLRESVLRVGIPPRLRGRVWPLAIGNNLHITRDLFNIMRERAHDALSHADSQFVSFCTVYIG